MLPLAGLKAQGRTRRCHAYGMHHACIMHACVHGFYATKALWELHRERQYRQTASMDLPNV